MRYTASTFSIPVNVILRSPIVAALDTGVLRLVIHPMAEHGDCGGYKPVSQVLNYGTVAFQSPDWLATVLWKLEQFIRQLRVKRVRSL